MVTLSESLKSGFADMAVSRQSRRVGLLADLVTIIDANDSVGKNARIFDEVISSATRSEIG